MDFLESIFLGSIGEHGGVGLSVGLEAFPWAPTLVPIMGISLVSQPSDSIPCSYYMPKAYHVVVSLEVCIISFEASSL
jgi:hypothetical protein